MVNLKILSDSTSKIVLVKLFVCFTQFTHLNNEPFSVFRLQVAELIARDTVLVRKYPVRICTTLCSVFELTRQKYRQDSSIWWRV